MFWKSQIWTKVCGSEFGYGRSEKVRSEQRHPDLNSDIYFLKKSDPQQGIRIWLRIQPFWKVWSKQKRLALNSDTDVLKKSDPSKGIQIWIRIWMFRKMKIQPQASGSEFGYSNSEKVRSEQRHQIWIWIQTFGNIQIPTRRPDLNSDMGLLKKSDPNKGSATFNTSCSS
jgi:hypothetical protein